MADSQFEAKAIVNVEAGNLGAIAEDARSEIGSLADLAREAFTTGEEFDASASLGQIRQFVSQLANVARDVGADFDFSTFETQITGSLESVARRVTDILTHAGENLNSQGIARDAEGFSRNGQRLAPEVVQQVTTSAFDDAVRHVGDTFTDITRSGQQVYQSLQDLRTSLETVASAPKIRTSAEGVEEYQGIGRHRETFREVPGRRGSTFEIVSPATETRPERTTKVNEAEFGRRLDTALQAEVAQIISTATTAIQSNRSATPVVVAEANRAVQNAARTEQVRQPVAPAAPAAPTPPPPPPPPPPAPEPVAVVPTSPIVTAARTRGGFDVRENQASITGTGGNTALVEGSLGDNGKPIYRITRTNTNTGEVEFVGTTYVQAGSALNAARKIAGDPVREGPSQFVAGDDRVDLLPPQKAPPKPSRALSSKAAPAKEPEPEVVDTPEAAAQRQRLIAANDAVNAELDRRSVQEKLRVRFRGPQGDVRYSPLIKNFPDAQRAAFEVAQRFGGSSEVVGPRDPSTGDDQFVAAIENGRRVDVRSSFRHKPIPDEFLRPGESATPRGLTYEERALRERARAQGTPLPAVAPTPAVVPRRAEPVPDFLDLRRSTGPGPDELRDLLGPPPASTPEPVAEPVQVEPVPAPRARRRRAPRAETPAPTPAPAPEPVSEPEPTRPDRSYYSDPNFDENGNPPERPVIPAERGADAQRAAEDQARRGRDTAGIGEELERFRRAALREVSERPKQNRDRLIGRFLESGAFPALNAEDDDSFHRRRLNTLVERLSPDPDQRRRLSRQQIIDQYAFGTGQITPPPVGRSAEEIASGKLQAASGEEERAELPAGLGRRRPGVAEAEQIAPSRPQRIEREPEAAGATVEPVQLGGVGQFLSQLAGRTFTAAGGGAGLREGSLSQEQIDALAPVVANRRAPQASAEPQQAPEQSIAATQEAAAAERTLTEALLAKALVINEEATAAREATAAESILSEALLAKAAQAESGLSATTEAIDAERAYAIALRGRVEALQTAPAAAAPASQASTLVEQAQQAQQAGKSVYAKPTVDASGDESKGPTDAEEAALEQLRGFGLQNPSIGQARLRLRQFDQIQASGANIDTPEELTPARLSYVTRQISSLQSRDGDPSGQSLEQIEAEVQRLAAEVRDRVRVTNAPPPIFGPQNPFDLDDPAGRFDAAGRRLRYPKSIDEPLFGPPNPADLEDPRHQIRRPYRGPSTDEQAILDQLNGFGVADASLAQARQRDRLLQQFRASGVTAENAPEQLSDARLRFINSQVSRYEGRTGSSASGFSVETVQRENERLAQQERNERIAREREGSGRGLFGYARDVLGGGVAGIGGYRSASRLPDGAVDVGKSFSSLAQGFVGGASFNLFFGLQQGAFQALDAAVKLQRSFTDLQQTANFAGATAQFGQLREGVLSVSSATGVAASEIATLQSSFLALYRQNDANGNAINGGVTASRAQASTAQAAQFLELTGLNASDALPALRVAQNDFNLNPSQFSDLVVSTARSAGSTGQAGYGQVAQGLTALLPAAQSVGLSARQAGGLLAAAEQGSGLTGAAAGQQLGKILEQFPEQIPQLARLGFRFRNERNTATSFEDLASQIGGNSPLAQAGQRLLGGRQGAELIAATGAAARRDPSLLAGTFVQAGAGEQAARAQENTLTGVLDQLRTSAVRLVSDIYNSGAGTALASVARGALALVNSVDRIVGAFQSLNRVVGGGLGYLAGGVLAARVINTTGAFQPRAENAPRFGVLGQLGQARQARLRPLDTNAEGEYVAPSRFTSFRRLVNGLSPQERERLTPRPEGSVVERTRNRVADVVAGRSRTAAAPAETAEARAGQQAAQAAERVAAADQQEVQATERVAATDQTLVVTTEGLVRAFEQLGVAVTVATEAERAQAATGAVGGAAGAGGRAVSEAERVAETEAGAVAGARTASGSRLGGLLRRGGGTAAAAEEGATGFQFGSRVGNLATSGVGQLGLGIGGAILTSQGAAQDPNNGSLAANSERVLGYAGQGAAFGATLGPEGALAGAALGTLYGGYKSLQAKGYLGGQDQNIKGIDGLTQEQQDKAVAASIGEYALRQGTGQAGQSENAVVNQALGGLSSDQIASLTRQGVLKGGESAQQAFSDAQSDLTNTNLTDVQRDNANTRYQALFTAARVDAATLTANRQAGVNALAQSGNAQANLALGTNALTAITQGIGFLQSPGGTPINPQTSGDVTSLAQAGVFTRAQSEAALAALIQTDTANNPQQVLQDRLALRNAQQGAVLGNLQDQVTNAGTLQGLNAFQTFGLSGGLLSQNYNSLSYDQVAQYGQTLAQQGSAANDALIQQLEGSPQLQAILTKTGGATATISGADAAAINAADAAAGKPLEFPSTAAQGGYVSPAQAAAANAENARADTAAERKVDRIPSNRVTSQSTDGSTQQSQLPPPDFQATGVKQNADGSFTIPLNPQQVVQGAQAVSQYQQQLGQAQIDAAKLRNQSASQIAGIQIATDQTVLSTLQAEAQANPNANLRPQILAAQNQLAADQVSQAQQRVQDALSSGQYQSSLDFTNSFRQAQDQLQAARNAAQTNGTSIEQLQQQAQQYGFSSLSQLNQSILSAYQSGVQQAFQARQSSEQAQAGYLQSGEQGASAQQAATATSQYANFLTAQYGSIGNAQRLAAAGDPTAQGAVTQYNNLGFAQFQANINLAGTQAQTVAAQLTGQGNTAAAAQVAFQNANQSLQAFIAAYPAQANTQNEEFNKLQAQFYTTRAQALQAQVSQSETLIGEEIGNNQISLATGINQLQSLYQQAVAANNPTLAEQIRTQIQQYINQGNQNAQFNLPTNLNLPTLYEVRRTQATSAGNNYYGNQGTVNVNINIANPNQAQQAVNTIMTAVAGPPTSGMAPSYP